MKRTLKKFLCVALLIVTVFSVAACGDDRAQNQLDDLKAQLAHQQEQLQKLEELLDRQQEKNEELELQYSVLAQTIQKLQTSIDRLENSVPCEVTAVAASSGYLWDQSATSFVVYTQAQLQLLLNELDAEFESYLHSGDWFLRSGDTVINEEFFYEAAKNFDEKALVVSVFLSPCLGATVTNHYLWKSADALHVEIDYTHGNDTAVETVMVIMEVDRDDVAGMNSVVLELHK